MMKLFCDLCEKEIKYDYYVEQTTIIYYDKEQSSNTVVCKKCWKEFNKQSKKVK